MPATRSKPSSEEAEVPVVEEAVLTKDTSDLKAVKADEPKQDEPTADEPKAEEDTEEKEEIKENVEVEIEKPEVTPESQEKNGDKKEENGGAADEEKPKDCDEDGSEKRKADEEVKPLTSPKKVKLDEKEDSVVPETTAV